jgi:peptidoglycan L-alanyl-D-glutamate endopeptidase CwlK
MPTFGQRSINNLMGVHADLLAIAERAIEVTATDFCVIEGLRGPERQGELVLAGASRTLQSKHLIGHAIDVAAWVGGTVSWEWHHYPVIAAAFRQASRESGIPVVWGAVWDRQLASLSDELDAEVAAYKARRKGKAFIDSGHFELRMEPPAMMRT